MHTLTQQSERGLGLAGMIETLMQFCRTISIPIRIAIKRARSRIAIASPRREQTAMQDLSLPPLPHSGPMRTVMVIDVSVSMDTDDYPPTRLGAAKHSAKKYVEARRQVSADDSAAVVAFASDAECVCRWTPLRSRADEVFQTLDSMETKSATSIGAGLAKAEGLFTGIRRGFLQRLLFGNSSGAGTPLTVQGTLRRIILLTDGGHNAAPAPRSIAKRIKDAGIIIECIGIGAREDIDEDPLKKIASVVNGRVRYRYVGDSEGLDDQFRRFGGLAR